MMHQTMIRPNTRKTLISLEPVRPIEAFELSMREDPVPATPNDTLPRGVFWTFWGIALLASLAIWTLGILLVMDLLRP